MSLEDVISGASAGSALGPIGALAGGVAGFLGGKKRRSEEKAANAAAAGAADPFAANRQAFSDQLMALYGIQKPYEYANQTELSNLEQRQNMSQNLTPEQMAKSVASEGGGFKGALSNAQTRLAMNSGLSPEEQKRLQELQSEKAQLEAQYKQNAPKPEDILKNIPGYQAAIDAGTKAATRRAAATGMGLSGNLLDELQRTGTNTAATFFNQEANRLSTLAGANVNPGAAAPYLAAVPTMRPNEGLGGLLGTLPDLFSRSTSDGSTSGAAATNMASPGVTPSGFNESQYWSDVSPYI